MQQYRDKEEAIRQMVRRSLERRRQVIVYDTARKLQRILGEQGLHGDSSKPVGTAWVKIESLSQLRAIVGGRFQNLKDRWVGAGFPLREHRGDRSGKKNFDFEGWTELSSWILKQGFELRLAAEDEPWLFEIRTIEG